jgi:tetratricopeptide (TPR) repeat protein
MVRRTVACTVSLLGVLLAVPLVSFTQEPSTPPPVAAPANVVPEIQWRTDYAAALKESQDRNLPLVIDIGTVNCYWCKKLDESTFRDARVVRALNERFVPLRIDGEKEPSLVQLLRITSYPTVVLASPDKRIIGTMEGFQEAEKFHDNLQRAIAGLTPADWMTRDLQSATKWASSGDFARAIPLLRTLVEDAKARPLHAQAGKILQEIEEQAAQRLANARQMHDKGQTTDAIEALTETMRLFPGLETTKTVAATLASMVKVPEAQNQHRTKRARELLTQAKDFYQSKDYIPCLDRCELLLAGYGDLAEGQEANKLASEIKSNPEWLQGACDTLGDRLGSLYLSLADSLLKRGDPQRAEFYLQRVIQGFPGSRHAESAQIRLTQLQNLYPRKTEAQSGAP